MMEISGSYHFNAPPDRVWDLLMDPVVIPSCIPGCDRFEPDGEDRYRVRLTVGLAAITGTYEGTVVISDKVLRTSYRLTVEGQGKPGFVKGGAAMALRPDGATTIVDVSGTVQAGGPIARVGQRLIKSVSKMMLDRFFACLPKPLKAACPRLRSFQRASREDGDHRAAVFLAGVDVGVDILQAYPCDAGGRLDSVLG